ncbi:LMBR1 integral membrane family protein [Blastocystis sp. ATCC 50177/Nand II]|uniref:LMBR1 integral membrane family protein n=1 Tax=Blastocystis sp. subtype 1 (strain ATCC 50177 / NandII) TaxID=478820 RepID=A0A196S812_BLAHN|nr:LMBR1 integral membrane family protein [Blastocystis sp. ATCC 50177/Nand II]
MDFTLLILLILFPIFTILIACRLVGYYLSDDFAHGYYMGKIAFVFCITVAVCAICFFPLDVANAGGSATCGIGIESCKKIPFTYIWYGVFALIVLLLCVVLPFTVFFYETMDIDQPPIEKRMQSACSYTLGTVVVVAALSFIFCFLIRKADIDMVSYNITAANTFAIADDVSQFFIVEEPGIVYNKSILSVDELEAADAVSSVADVFSVDVSFIVRLIALFCILGWLFFVIFAGIGVIGLPYKLIYGFINRPTYMPKERFNEEKQKIGVRIQALIAQGESITKMMDGAKNGNYGWKEKRRMKKEAKAATAEYRAACKALDEDYLTLRAEHLNYKENNPLLPVAKLVLGILSIVASILWLLQLALYVFPIQFTGGAITPFLNSMFIGLNDYLPMLASVLLLVFALYFMFCTINGAFSFGLRMFLMNVHEMEPHDTLITSLVFNGGLVLMVVLPLLQFCSKAFGDYAARSEVIGIFGVQIEYLRYVSWLFKHNVFLWIMLAFIVFACFYYSCRRSDKERKMRKTMKKLKEEDKHGIELKKMKEERDAKEMV